jgi:hypothetical protein
VIEQFVGEVRVLEDGKARGATIRLDQEDLESVIPKVGSQLLILNGRGRGFKGTLLQINEAHYNVDLKARPLLAISYLCSTIFFINVIYSGCGGKPLWHCSERNTIRRHLKNIRRVKG